MMIQKFGLLLGVVKVWNHHCSLLVVAALLLLMPLALCNNNGFAKAEAETIETTISMEEYQQCYNNSITALDKCAEMKLVNVLSEGESWGGNCLGDWRFDIWDASTVGPADDCVSFVTNFCDYPLDNLDSKCEPCFVELENYFNCLVMVDVWQVGVDFGGLFGGRDEYDCPTTFPCSRNSHNNGNNGDLPLPPPPTTTTNDNSDSPSSTTSSSETSTATSSSSTSSSSATAFTVVSQALHLGILVVAVVVTMG